MRKLLIFIGLFLTVSLSGQIFPGVVASQRGILCIGTQNLVKYSEQIDNAIWKGTSVTVTADQEYDLIGNLTMELLTCTSTTGNMTYYNVNDYIVVIPGQTYRFSFDVKRGTMTELKYSVYDWTHSANITGATSYYSSTSTSVQRVSFSFIVPAGCIKAAVYFIRDPGVTGTVYVGRAQVETNGSCYITTTTSIITP